MLNRLLLSTALLLSLNACDSSAFKNVLNKEAPNGQQQESTAAQVAYKEAYKAAQAKDPARELTILMDANAKYPNDPYLLRPLGYAYIDNKRVSEAIPVFDRLIKSNPNTAQSYADKAVALDFTRQHADAQALYKQALALSPGNASFQNNLAMSMLLNNQIDEAISILEPLSKQPGATKKTRQNLALALGLKGDVQKALILDSQDLTPEQVKQNEQFYEQYGELARKNKAATSAPPPPKEPEGNATGGAASQQTVKIINGFENNPMSTDNSGQDKTPANKP